MIPRSPIAVLLLGGAVACSSNGPVEPIRELPRNLSVSEQEVVQASNAFGLELFRRVVAEDGRPNVVLSPLSASMALGMALSGAAGETFDAMSAALGFEGLQPGAIEGAYRDLLDLLRGLDPDVRMEVANALWGNEEVRFRPEFLEAVERTFDAEVSSSDFADPATLEEINAWARDHTDGRIEQILDVLAPDLVALLLNATFFEGAWTTRFDPEDTAPSPFTREDGSAATVAMMHLRDARVARTGGDGWSAIDLPYGRGAFSMTVVVPERDPRAFVRELDDARWEEIIGGFGEPTRLDLLTLPRFRLSYDAWLNDALRDMGMETAFGRGADFSRMAESGERFCLDFVRQKTFLEVDEEGTTAAAVTAVGVGLVSFSGFLVDRPFVLAIRERFTGTVLFLGLVGDPTLEQSPEAVPQAGCMA